MKQGLSRAKLVPACALAALALAAPAAAEVAVGVADNRPKSSPDQAERFFDTMRDVGLVEDRIAVTWDPADPTTIKDRDAIDQTVAIAEAKGIRLVVSVYPSQARAITGSSGATAQFAHFLQLLARAYPAVKDFIVGNEPNKNLFWQPQFNPNGSGAACAAYESLLAASYDALKAVDPEITVIGLGLGPRGGDNAFARGNLSISPVRCLRDIGRAYRASRRTRPIMDELSYHAHPNSSTDRLELGYTWPNAGVPNLARIKQAIWDAFHGTAQPVVQEAGLPGGPLRPLRFRLAEVGWQVAIPPSSAGAYYGRENVATTDEGRQAAIYGNVIPLVACDPAVRSLLFFNLVDEPDLERWQSGLLRADWTRRPSYGIVKGALAAGANRCSGRPVAWRHQFRVVGANARFSDARRQRSARNASWSFLAGAEEDASYIAGVFRTVRPGAVPSSRRGAILRALRAGRPRAASLAARGKLVRGTRIVRFPARRLKPGYYVYAIRLAAETNPARTSFFLGRSFRVGEPVAGKKRSGPKRPG